MNSAMLIIFGALLVSLLLGIMARRGKDMGMEQWAIGGRGFGSLFVFLLLAGETYSVFTLLGTSGLAYSKGAVGFYLIAFTTLGAMTSYWLLPPIWKYAKKHNLVSQSEFFASKYDSPILGVFVTIVGVVALVPYIVLLFKSMGILVSATSYGAISPSVAILIGMVALVVYVMISGIHGSAWTSTVKDFLIFFVILFLGIYLPIHYHGSIQQMFEAVNTAKEGILTFPEKGMSLSWFISTVAISAFGYFMWPHNAPTIFAAKSARTFRTNAILLPLYALMILFVYFVGFTAIVEVPGLVGADGDYALLKLSMKTFDPWFVGIIGATGLLSTLVPGSMMLMSTATMLTKNVYGYIRPQAEEKNSAKVAKVFVVLLSLVCGGMALGENNTLATLYLTSFSLVTQLAPALYCSLMKRNAITKQGAFLGIFFGVGIVVYMTFTKTTMAMLFAGMPQWIQDLNNGVFALVVNIIVMLVASLVTRKVTEPGQMTVSETTK